MAYQGIRVTTEVYELIKRFRVHLIKIRATSDIPTMSEAIKEAIDKYPIEVNQQN